MAAKNSYWFVAKRNGWGWGLPCRWQGWCTLLAYLATVVMTTVFIDPQTQQWLWLLCFALYSLTLLAIMWKTGAPPKWQWRKKDRADRWKTW